MHRLLNIKSDNRGATMVIVLISIMFITILGAILLFTAYTGFQVKVSQAVGENRFYDAETAMDEITAGLQAIVSDNVANSFTELMITFDGDYAKLDDEFIKQFRNTFLDAGGGLFVYTGSSDLDDYFNFAGYSGGIEFNLAAISSFITDTTGAVDVSVSGGTVAGRGAVDFFGKWVPDSPPTPIPGKFVMDTIVLKGLRVTHTTGDGYLSIVDTDINIDIPNFNSTLSMISLGAFARYAIIATGVMDSKIGTTPIDIDGNIYVGSVELIGGGTAPVTLQNGRMLISGGDVTDPAGLGPNGNINVVNRDFVTLENTSVWARNIKVGRTLPPGALPAPSGTGSVDLRGNTNVAGSLILDGTRVLPDSSIIGSTANLSGNYRGFGTGRPPAPDPLPPGYIEPPLDPLLSSTIIVNGRHSRLDLSGLNNLYLSGQTFIQAVDTDVMTGQSIAVRSDQLAYLIPPALIENMDTNPLIINSASSDIPLTLADIPTPDIDYTTPIWEGTARTLGSYISSYHPVLYNMPGVDNQAVLFVFMQFDSIDSANAYFMDYFQNNTDDISSYIDIYMRWYRAASNVHSSGVTYVGTNADNFNVLPATGPISSSVFYRDYENLRRILARNGTYDFSAYPAENPFHFVIKSQPAPGSYEFGGDVTGYVHCDPSDPSATPPITLTALATALSDPNLEKLSIIVSYGDVIVDMDYEGLILCDADIDLRDSISATGSQALRSALLAVNAAGERLGDSFNVRIDDDNDYEKGETWNFNQLVYYDNWKKE